MVENAQQRILQFTTRLLSDMALGVEPRLLAEQVCLFAEQISPDSIAYVMRLAPEGHLSLWVGPHVPVAMGVALARVVPGPRAGSCANVAYRQEPVLVDNIAQDARWDEVRALAERWSLAACWSFPIWQAEEVIGTFALVRQSPATASARVLDLLDACASLLGTVIEHHRLKDQDTLNRSRLNRCLQFNELLSNVNRWTVSESDLNQLYRQVCESAVKIAHCRLASVVVPDGPHHIRVVASAGQLDDLDELMFSVEGGGARASGPIGTVWNTGQGLFIQNFDQPALQDWRDRVHERGIFSCAALPVLRQDQVAAVLNLYHGQADIFDDELQSLLGALAISLSGGVERIHLQQQVRQSHAIQKHLATHDALTGLPNRMLLDQNLPLAMARARQDQTLVAVCVLDLDDFKSISDRFGQEGGDQLLRLVARRLRDRVRNSDLVIRSGGDEFVVVAEGLLRYEDLLPNLDQWAQLIAEPLELGEGDAVCLSVTIGVALFPDDDVDSGQLLRHAFEAMSALKKNKQNRIRAWQIWDESKLRIAGSERRDIAPYGADAQAILAPLEERLSGLTQGFMDKIREFWRRRPDMKNFFDALSEKEIELALDGFRRHILALQDPTLDEEHHRLLAESTGQRNTLIGVTHATFIEGTQIYHDYLRQQLHELHGMRLGERQSVLDVLATRLRLELQGQIRGMQHLMVERQAWLSEQSIRLAKTRSWIDMGADFVESIIRLHGFVAASLTRMTVTGHLEQEFATHSTLNLLELDDADPRPITAQASGENTWPGMPAHLRVWHSEQIETNLSFATEPHLKSLSGPATLLRIRSAAFIPIADANGRVALVLGVYGHHPGQFESAEMQLFLRSLGYLIEQARLRLLRAHAQPLQSAEQRREYRRRLDHGGLVMVYQPIMNLRSGQIVKVEALARLRLGDGSLVGPATFLPAFGVRELTLLFQRGLEHVLERLMPVLNLYPSLSVSLNLPPGVLLEFNCREWIEQTLGRYLLPPQRLELEVLEDEEFHDLDRARDILLDLSSLGVRLTMDDLGAGYSSLLRLRRLPFSTVKIDQGLVREVGTDAERVIAFIAGLVRMARSLKLKVLVEGLETPDLIEMAGLLEADEGQGYALSRPMPLEGLQAWLRDFCWKLSSGQNPQTPLGQQVKRWRSA